MTSSAILVFTAVVLAAVNLVSAGDEKESLFSETMRHMSDCSQTIEVDMGVCTKMLDDNADRNDAKYDNCKSMGVCMSTGFGVMVGNSFNFDKMEEHKLRITGDEYKSEADKVLKECRDTPLGKDEKESMLNMATCALKTSSVFKDTVVKIAKSMSDDDSK